MAKLEYLGEMRVDKAYGGWIRKIKDPKTVGIRINKDNATLLIGYLAEYLRQENDSSLILTIYRKSENENGIRTTVTIPS